MNTALRVGWLRCLLSGLALFFVLASAAGHVMPANAQADQQQTPQTYVVKAGETLFRIALRYSVTVEALVAANHLVDASHIYAGQTLVIPGAVASVAATANSVVSGPVYYRVQVGDTLNHIAQAYGVTSQAIISANNLLDANHIEVGQALIIPGVSAPGGSATVPQLPVQPAVTPTAVAITATPVSSPTALPPTASPTAIPPTVTAAPTVPAPTVPAPTAAPAKTYTVQPGEGLAAIARRFGVDWTAIAATNNIADPNRIYAGMVLKIPAASTGAPPTTMETSAGVPPGPLAADPNATANKQIVVVLHEERVYAYENGVLVRNVLVSTGLPGTPTVTGTYHIYVKYTAQLMVGPNYYLPNVPWVMYFYEGYGLHGTYWHHNWGHPMSHGCVNMPTDEAKWLYSWAPVGTPVTVMW